MGLALRDNQRKSSQPPHSLLYPYPSPPQCRHRLTPSTVVVGSDVSPGHGRGDLNPVTLRCGAASEVPGDVLKRETSSYSVIACNSPRAISERRTAAHQDDAASGGLVDLARAHFVGRSIICDVHIPSDSYYLSTVQVVKRSAVRSAFIARGFD
jgi:hypothetical protein